MGNVLTGCKRHAARYRNENTRRAYQFAEPRRGHNRRQPRPCGEASSGSGQQRKTSGRGLRFGIQRFRNQVGIHRGKTEEQ